MAREEHYVAQDTVDMVNQLLPCASLPGWMRMPGESGQVTDYWCMGTRDEVENLMERTELTMRPKYNDCRILNMRISWVKGSIIKLFVGWIQLLHLQDN